MLKKKIIFRIPKKNNCLIYRDFFSSFEDIQKKFSINDKTETVTNKTLNLFILLKIFFSFKSLIVMFKYGFKISYFFSYINFVQPKIFLTSIDNDKNFYSLKKFFKKVKFLSFQNAFRRKTNDFFDDKTLDKKESLECDFFFVWGDFFKNHYKKYIKSKYFVIGSLKNILTKKNFKNSKKKKIVFISSARDIYNSKLKNNTDKNELLSSYVNYEKKIIKNLFIYCNNKGYKFNILSKLGSAEEKNYFKRIILSNNFNFIKTKIPQKYTLLENYELTVSIFSSLAIENFSLGRKSIFFPPRNKISINRFDDLNFSWPNKTADNLFYFYRDPTFFTMSKIIDNTLKLNNQEWKQRTISLNKIIKNISLSQLDKIIKKNLPELFSK